MASFATALVAIVAFGVAQQDVALLLGASIPAAASWILTEGPARRGVPKWITTPLVLAVLAWTLLQGPLQGDPLALARLVGSFVLWTSVIKLYERKSTRDRRQLLGLSLVLMLAGCLLSVDLLFAVLLVIYAVLVIASLMLYRLERGGERHGERVRAVAGLVAPPPPVYGGRAGRHLRRVVVSGLVIGIVASLLLFVLFPRDLLQRFEGWASAARMTGFRAEVELRRSAPIENSRREVMTVAWMDPAGERMRSPEPLRLRGAVLDQYEPGPARWVASRRGQFRPISVGDDRTFEPLARPPIETRQQTWTLVVEPRLMLTEVLFAPWAPVALAYPGHGVVFLNGETLELRDQEISRGPRIGRYQVKVQPFIGPDALAALGHSALRWRWPGFPVDGVEDEARRVLAQVGEKPPDREALATNEEARWAWARNASSIFLRYLQGSGFRYSTDLSSLVLRRGEDPIEAFIKRGRSGHCELFASALCGMLQSVGVEARMVVGFVAVEYDGSARHYVVRESNAHAWVEVRTGTWSWTTVDPTPASTLETLSEPGRRWGDSLRWLYDGIDFLWRTQVVAFDSNAQRSLVRGAGDRVTQAAKGLLAALGSWMDTLARQFEAGGIGRVWAISVVITLAGMIATAVLLSRRGRRRRRLLRLDEVPVRERRRLKRDGVFFADALQMLEAAGLAKPEWRPPRLHSEWLVSVNRGAGEAFGALVERYYNIRFGGVAPSRTDQTETTALLRRLESGLRRAP